MPRRFDESQLVGTSAEAPATTSLPGFVACSSSDIPIGVQLFWHALYQAAYAQSILQMTEQPSKYQRLVFQVCLN
jgi:hypothetical protein